MFVTPFTLAGAMAPVTIAGAVTQQTAEALCAIALLQCVSPGAPVVYGSFTSNVDMKSGAPAFGTPEYVRATQIPGQMARYYGLPLRASNACASNAPDAQAAWESMNSLWSACTSKANVVYHAAGWLEGGLIASYEKFVMDCEMLQQIEHYMKPITTRRRHRGRRDRRGRPAQPLLRRRAHAGALRDGVLQRRSSPTGATTRHGPRPARRRRRERANRIWKRSSPSSSRRPRHGDREELREFVERRKREGGAPTDF